VGSSLEDAAKHPPVTPGSRTPAERLGDALARQMVNQSSPGSLYPDQVELLADVARRRADGKLDDWELRAVKEFEAVGVYLPPVEDSAGATQDGESHHPDSTDPNVEH